ncbi:MAG TPA: hypothetical protein VM051_09390 [Usitatibacter sp.]|nr:hypothetical protein [Usitatibacter sp.]
MTGVAGAALMLVAGAFVMLGVPFLPMWREWRHPTDHHALAVGRDDSNDVDHFARRLRHATQERVAREAWSAFPSRAGTPDHGEIIAAGPLVAAVQVHCTRPLRVAGDFSAPSGSTFDSLLVDGDLDLGTDSQILQWARAEGHARLGSGTVAVRRLSAGREIALSRECTFERMSAPRITYGNRLARPRRAAGEGGDLDPTTLPGATRQAPGLVRIDGDAMLPAGLRVVGSLVVGGMLHVGEGARVCGSVKAHRGVVAGRGSMIEGAVVSRRDIHLRAGCEIGGPVVSEADIVIGEDVVVGSAGRRTSITAESILVGEGTVTHGTVWAHDVGVVWGA